jgi:hypothetical protein
VLPSLRLGRTQRVVSNPPPGDQMHLTARRLPPGQRRQFTALIVACAVALTTGCAATITQPIPYRPSLRLQAAPTEKIDRALTVRMSEQLGNLVATVKPIDMPLAITYTFAIGNSLKANLANTLGSMFTKVTIDTSNPAPGNIAPLTLNVELKSYELTIAPTIFGTHSTQLNVQYTLDDEHGTRLLTLLTETHGTSAGTTGELLGRVFVPGEVSQSSGYRASIGRAYDQALAQSIDALATNLLQVLAH